MILLKFKDTLNFTSTTFDVDVPSQSAAINGNVNVSLPIDFCFYLVSTGTITNINQFFPYLLKVLIAAIRESNIKYNTYRKITFN